MKILLPRRRPRHRLYYAIPREDAPLRSKAAGLEGSAWASPRYGPSRRRMATALMSPESLEAQAHARHGRRRWQKSIKAPRNALHACRPARLLALNHGGASVPSTVFLTPPSSMRRLSVLLAALAFVSAKDSHLACALLPSRPAIRSQPVPSVPFLCKSRPIRAACCHPRAAAFRRFCVVPPALAPTLFARPV
ncbi:hypothetical protein BS50DRAFT_186443 [Corynespora cassiicola Philippines]|uniref:Uncharacterized protein n=1 Tax=Corynespora cassiicola Philippines TaxID=1448308 RepID=A0A2T2P7A7_CORCC|nr:hypothetical protein BS50DRAFT_186443 [Corynespora cassiicola Philippines]